MMMFIVLTARRRILVFGSFSCWFDVVLPKNESCHYTWNATTHHIRAFLCGLGKFLISIAGYGQTTSHAPRRPLCTNSKNNKTILGNPLLYGIPNLDLSPTGLHITCANFHFRSTVSGLKKYESLNHLQYSFLLTLRKKGGGNYRGSLNKSLVVLFGQT